MKLIHIFSLFILICIISCEREPNGPETNCDLQESYQLDYNRIKSGKVFDVRQMPPQEIKNNTLSALLIFQFNHTDDPQPPPYDRYFIDTVDFIDQQNAR